MQVLYIWVKRYGNFYEQEFNLSSKFKFSYKNKTLHCRLNEKYIKNFFNNFKSSNQVIKEVTAIVGNNGSGKTTILDLIMNLNNLNNTNYIIVTLNSNEEIVVNTNIKDVVIFKLDGYRVAQFDQSKHSGDLNCIYHSNMLDHRYTDGCEKNYIKDISTTNLIMRCEDSQKHTNKDEEELIKDIGFFYNDFKMQLDFISSFDNKEDFIDFNLPKLLHIKTIGNKVYRNLIAKNMVGKYEDMKLYEIKLKMPINQNDPKIGDKLVSEYIAGSLSMTLHNLKRAKQKLAEQNSNLFKFVVAEGVLFNFLLEKIDQIEYDEENLIEMMYIIDELPLKFGIEYYDENGFVKYVISIIDKYSENYNSNINIKLLNRLLEIETVPKLYEYNNITGITEYIINTKHIDSIKRLYNIYKNSTEIIEYLHFSWKMSSGEYNMLSLYSRLYCLIDTNINQVKFNNNKIKDDFITVLIDEADMSFHPEWQRKYIEKLLNFFNKVYFNHQIHIIFTTHSPILLSDIPSENIIYLKKEKNETLVMDNNKNKTFGANIYNLYNDNFFFNSNNNFGIIGEFATNKIINMISKIDKYCNNFNEEHNLDYGKQLLKSCQNLINIIGEDYINIILKDKYIKLERLLNIKLEPNINIDNHKEYFKSMSEKEKKEFIKYIIEYYK